MMPGDGPIGSTTEAVMDRGLERGSDASAGVRWWQRGLVVLAALAAGVAAVWAVTEATTALLLLYVPWPVVAVLPVLMWDQRAFRRACLAVGSCLVVVGVLGTVLGLFIFIPAGLAVLAAAATGGRLTWVGAAVSGVIALVTLGYGISQVVPLYGPPTAFVVQFDGRQYQGHADLLDQLAVNPPRFGHGATDVGTGADDTGPQWTVSFDSNLSPQGQAALRSYLSGLPAVTNVRLCDSPRECGR